MRSRSKKKQDTTRPVKRRKSRREEHVRPTGVQAFSARDLQKLEFPPLEFCVDGLVTEGLALLAGKPKMGKSWMAIDIAMAVATGSHALGERACIKGTTLYCALEDNQRRLQRRMRHVYGNDTKWPTNFYFATRLNHLDDGGLEELEEWIEEHDPSLVIIDTLVSVRSKARRETGYDMDYATLAPLQKLAADTNTAIIVVHHLRKMHGDDPLDMVSGTTGLTGAVDTVLVLRRESFGTALYGRGREIEEFDIALQLVNGRWQVLGNTEQVKTSDERKAIIDVLAKSDKPMGPKAIAEELERPPENIRQLLSSMVIDGDVQTKARGQYILSPN